MLLLFVAGGSDGGGARVDLAVLWGSALPALPGDGSLEDAVRARVRGQSRRALSKYARTMMLEPQNLRAGLGYASVASDLGRLAEAHQVAVAINRRHPGVAVRAALAELSLEMGHAGEVSPRTLLPGSHGEARNHAVVLIAMAGLLWNGPAGLVRAFALLGDRLPGSVQLGYPEQHTHSHRLARLTSALLPQRGAQLAWDGMRRAMVSGSDSELADYLTVVAAIDSATGSMRRALVFARAARRRAIVAGDRRSVYLSLAQSALSSARRNSLPPVCEALDGIAPHLAVDCRLERLAVLWGRGELEPAVVVYERLAADPMRHSSPILTARFADVAAPLLGFLGRWSALEETLDRGARAAKQLGRRDAATRIELARVATLRALGRTVEARERLVVLSEEVVHNGAPLRLNGVVQRPQRPQREHPMRLHGNAKTAPYTRELMVRRVLKQAEPVRDTAAAFGVSTTTLYKWLRRYREDGVAGLEDRSSRPHRSPRQTPAGVVHRILKLRRHRLTAWEISAQLSVPASTVSQWLRRQGVGRLRDLEPKPPVQRYERASPGEILHLDTKKLARIVRPGHRVHGDLARKSRGAGWEFAHVAVDDHSRVAYVQVMTKEDQYTCTEFLERAVAFFNARGVSIQRVMTDNGGGYISKRFNSACRKHRIGHLYTRPYTPRTNGKAERFIRTLKERWAYYRSYRTSAHRTRALVPWLNHYNRHRPHAGIGKRPPMSRLQSSS